MAFFFIHLLFPSLSGEHEVSVRFPGDMATYVAREKGEKEITF
jgi:hypothetical protein